jgi:DNA-binding response OmpR family regulator
MAVTYAPYARQHVRGASMTTYEIAAPTQLRTGAVLGNIALDLDAYRVTVAGIEVDTTYHELELLRLMCDQPDRIISFADLTRALWDSSDKAATRHLNVLIHRLRTKLADSAPYSIETVRGRGYGLLRGG